MADNATLVLSVEATEAIKDIAKFSKQSTEAGKKSQKSFNKMSKALKSIDFKSTFLVGAEAIRGFNAVASKLTGSLSTIIDAANTQEDAVNSLNTALALSGEYTEAASKGFQDWASSLQAASTAGDEQLLQQAALAKSFGATNEQAKQITEAALELSAATGKSLEEATRQVSKTLGGFAGELGEVNPAIKALTQEQLKAGEAAKILLDQYGGSASSKLNTFSGAIAQTSNTFGDLLESLGSLVTENPVIIEGVKIINGIFQELIQKVKTNSGSISKIITNAFKLMVRAVKPVIKAIGFIVKAILRIPYGLTIATGFISDFVAEALKKFKFLADTINKAFGIIGVEIDVTSFAESIRNGAVEISDSMETVMEGIDSGFEAVALSAEKVSDRIQKVNTTIGATKSEIKNVQKVQETFTDKFSRTLTNFANAFSEKLTGLIGSFISGTTAGVKAVESAGQAAREEATRENEKRIQEAADKGIKLEPTDLIDVELAGKQAEEKERKKQADDLGLKTIAGIGAAVADAYLPGLGQVVGPLVELLGQDSEQVTQMVEAIVKAGPEIIKGLAKNFGPLLDVLIDNMDEVTVALVDGLIEAAPDIIVSLLEAIPKIIANTFTQTIPKLWHLLINGIQRAFGYAWEGFRTAISSGAMEALLNVFTPTFAVWKMVGDNISKVANAMKPIQDFLLQIRDLLDTSDQFSGFEGGTAGTILGASTLGTVRLDNDGGVRVLGAKLPGFSSGGTVPGIGNSDTVPAMLTPGEVVVPKDDVTKLRNFLDSQTNNGGNDMQTALLSQMVTLLSQPQTVSTSAEINGEAFADIILQLNRNNQRLA